MLAAIGQGTAEDVDAAVAAARAAFSNGWSALPGSERAKYLFRIARILQERAREFAVLESLNGGKPIKESRDVDLPLAAAHFFYYAGWADKLEYAFPNRKPKPVGVAGQIIPWNFPLLMLAWKIAPALACGNTVVLKPAETTPLTALLFCDVLRQAELPAGVVNIVTGDGRTGAAIVDHPDVDKIAFTGSTDVGKAIRRRLAGTDKKLTLELGGKAANIVFDDAALDQAVEGIVNGIYFNQGHVCCAGSRLFAQESIYEPLVDKLKKRLETLRVGDPLDKNTDVGAINSRMQLEKIEELVAGRQGRGRRDLPAAVPAAGEGLLVRADRLHERRAELPHRAGGDLRPGAERAHVPHAGGGGREGEQHAVRPERRRLDGEGLAHPLDGAADARRRRVGEHVQPLRPDVAVRRLQGVGLRARGRPARSRAVPEVRRMSSVLRRSRRRTSSSSAARSRAASRAARTRRKGRTSRAARARTHATRCRRRARRSPGWAKATAYNRGQVLYRVAEMVEARAAEFAELCSGRDEVERSIDRIVWYAGWADKLPQVLGGSNPVAGPYFNFTVPEPTGVVAVLAPDEPPLLGLVSRLMPPLVGGNAVVAVASETHPLAAIELAEAIATSDVPGGVINILTGTRADMAPTLASHMDVNAIDLCGANGFSTELEELAAENVKRIVRGRADVQSPWEISSFLELKTVWHPIGQ